MKPVYLFLLLAGFAYCQLPCDPTDQCIASMLSRLAEIERRLSRLDGDVESHVEEMELQEHEEPYPTENLLCPCMQTTDEDDVCYSCGDNDFCNKKTYITIFSGKDDANKELCITGVEGEDRWHNSYQETFESGIQEGAIVLVRGYLHSDESFSVNIKTGNDSLADNAFHFNPRKNTGTLVMNSHQHGNWQGEQRLGQNDYLESMYKNKPFEIKIAVSALGFHVYGNAKELTFFAHRVDVSRLNTLFISGDVHVYEDKVMDPLTVPMFSRLPETMEGLHTGRHNNIWVLIQMTPNNVSESIRIYFCENNKRSGNIHLSFVPNMKEKVTIRSSIENGISQVEERDQPGFPFLPGETAEVAFLFTSDLIQIFVNRDHYVDFQPRLPLRDIHYIYMNGANFYAPEMYYTVPA